MMVRICFLPEVEVSHSVYKSMHILLKGHSRISIIFRRQDVLWQSVQLAMYFLILIHASPVVLAFY